MGYYSSFQIEFSPEYNSEGRRYIELFRESWEDAAWAVDEDGMPNDSVKWYDHLKDVLEFSKKEKDPRITLETDGEEWEYNKKYIIKGGDVIKHFSLEWVESNDKLC